MPKSSWTVAAELCAAEVTVQIRDYQFPSPNEGTEYDDLPILGFHLARPRRVGAARHRFSSHAFQYGSVGALIFAPGGVALDTRGSGGHHRVAAYRFPRARFEAVTGLTDWDARRLDACLDVRDPLVEQAALRLASEVQAPGFASSLLADCTGLSLMIELARFLRARSCSLPSSHRLSPTQLATIRSLVEETVGRQPRLEDFAGACGMGGRSLARAFRESTGITIGRFAEERRIERAKILLAGTRLPLKEIAYQLGFAHPPAFTAAFRRATGVPPLKFRAGVSA